ncbi:hypothetical protein [Kibdelosporangium phytohabitans]|uniref:Uncharacterized protein n=1 Tax=Kibdelosporangium phytohabitans TaxID=860235 RepID=A0A0N7F2D6_9PSEU|nr:hypothetical protein [Kibdelosporangium phytohabitans]ALG05535.1 hypothetical protein AOZ06_00070 [Kibdelosporangium phytohabitans]MBE1466511.1 hypothetical protein [Kibdelosporangium phytohabitans]
MHKELRLGVDFGRVINDGSSHPGGDDTVFLSGSVDDAMRTPAMADAFDTLARLTDEFGGNVWVVSKAGERIQERTMQWLDHNGFWSATGIPRANARFCRKRPEKAVHCKQLGITHFIDDRRDVLGHMRGIVPNLYLFGVQKADPPEWAIPTLTWADVETAVTEGIAAEPPRRATRRSRRA